MVAEDDSHQKDRQQQRKLIDSAAVKHRTQQNERIECRPGHRSQRNIAGDQNQRQSDGDQHQQNQRMQRSHRAESGGHPLPALEPEIDRIHMPEHRSNGRRRSGVHRLKPKDRREPAGDQHRQGALEHIAEEGGKSGFVTERPHHVGGSRIAAAVIAHVIAEKETGDQNGAVNAPEQIGDAGKARHRTEYLHESWSLLTASSSGSASAREYIRRGGSALRERSG